MNLATKKQIIDKLADNPLIEVVWLYGSRAAGTETQGSDYDIAVALAESIGSAGRMSLCEDLQYALCSELGLPISVVDINKIPVPLAQNVVSQGVVLHSSSDLRLRAEEQRVWSLWEEYRFEHEHNRQTL